MIHIRKRLNSKCITEKIWKQNTLLLLLERNGFIEEGNRGDGESEKEKARFPQSGDGILQLCKQHAAIQGEGNSTWLYAGHAPQVISISASTSGNLTNLLF